MLSSILFINSSHKLPALPDSEVSGKVFTLLDKLTREHRVQELVSGCGCGCAVLIGTIAVHLLTPILHTQGFF